MLSVLIETRNDEEGLARTLASLIGGAVEGVVRDVVVCDTGSTDQTQRVADQAGCHFVATGGIAAAIGQAKGDWLLLLEPGARLVDGWIDEVVAHASKSSLPGRFSRTAGSRVPLFSRAFSRPTALAEGLLIAKARAAALAKSTGTAEALARGLATKRLGAEIWVAQRAK